MKRIRVININEGQPKEAVNDNCFCVVEFPRTEILVAHYLDRGYTISQVLKGFEPNILQQGRYPFYDTGIVLILEKEVESNEDKDEEDRFFEEIAETVAQMEAGFVEDDMFEDDMFEDE